MGLGESPGLSCFWHLMAAEASTLRPASGLRYPWSGT
jgi:hypothetical protein